jgi:uncharacterized Zn-binding protein involved in type VI secretion
VAGEIIRKGDRTDHDGTVLEGSETDICHGKPIAFIGHKVYCPKCKGNFPIVEGVVTTTIYGKGVAVAGMKTSCGAKLIPTQFTDVVEAAGGDGGGTQGASAARAAPAAAAAVAAAAAAATQPAADEAASEARPEKAVKRIYWSYGPDRTPVDSVSRHYVDLNLHVETEHYTAGETVEIAIRNDDGSELADGLPQLTVQAKVGSDNTACVEDVFKGKTVQIGTIG